MAKGQKRSNREAKKPKQPKSQRSGPLLLGFAAGPAAGERAPPRGPTGQSHEMG